MSGPTDTAIVGIENVDGAGKPDNNVLTQGFAMFSSSGSFGWVYCSLSPPLAVTAGTMYAIVLPDVTGASHGSTDTYSGGQAYGLDGSWYPKSDPAELAFQAYVDTVTTQLAWDKASITAGVATPLTLTATMTFANGTEASNYSAYSAILSALPSWFSAPDLTCSPLVATGDCTSDKLSGALNPLVVGAASNGATLTFTLTETVTAPLTAVGTSTVTGEACLVYRQAALNVVRPNAPGDPGCADGTASVAVAAPAAPTPTPTPPPSQSVQGETSAPTKGATPPPTSTGFGSSSNDSGFMIWFLPVGLLAFLGALVLASTRTRRRIA
jgi:hypothetical protein